MGISWGYTGNTKKWDKNWDNNGDIHSGNQTCLAGKSMKIIYKWGNFQQAMFDYKWLTNMAQFYWGNIYS